MTKKLAELSGSVSVISASLILVLAILVSSIPLPTLPIFSQNAMFSEESISDKANFADEGTKTTPIPAPEELNTNPSVVFSVSQGSFANQMFGLREIAGDRNTSHSVLATSQTRPLFQVTTKVTSEEYALLLYCVEHETRSGSIPHKAMIAQVILNRVQGPKFGSSVKEVVLAPNQFVPMSNYTGWGDWQPNQTTIEAVNLVLSGECPDYSQGAIYFCNPSIVGPGNWFDRTRPVVCEMEGHRFYR